jgi:hypothetical protein
MTCLEGNKSIFDQINQTLGKLTIYQYTQGLDVFEGSSIGMHFRHIFDFYQCIEKSLVSGHLDYCKRERNPLIENDPEIASRSFSACFLSLKKADENQSLIVWADFSTTQTDRPRVQSSVGREMMYAFDHAVHHLAIIKIGIKTAFPEINLDEGFGVAPSTQKHQKAVIHNS